MSRHAGASHRALTVRGSAKARMHYVQGSVAKRAGQESAGVATLSQRAGAASEAAEAAHPGVPNLLTRACLYLGLSSQPL
jgi:hypothetical protein